MSAAAGSGGVAAASATAHLSFRILGPVEAEREGERIQLGPPKQRAFLALLLLNLNQAVSRERLVDELWPDDPPPTAVKALQVYVSRLRKELGSDAGCLVTRGSGYALECDPAVLDASRFERLLADGQGALARGDAQRARAALDEALSLWRGPALADLLEEELGRREGARLEELRLLATETRLEAALSLGEEANAVAELERLVAQHPLREGLTSLLMRALYRIGRQADALAAYQRARRALVDELGIEPGPALQDLNRAILNQDPGLGAASRASEPGAPTPGRARVPVPANRLIGRERELEEIARLLERSRFVTVTGPGGTGKTRLALELARREQERGAVAFVALASLSDPELVPAAIAEAAGIAGGGAAHLDVLKQELATAELVLVLDNLEHLLETAPALAALLESTENVRVLATSREPLRLSGEHEYPLEPLSARESYELFEERAQAAKPSFDAGRQAGAVREICRRLDGLPLALELAAARVRILAPDELLLRLEHSLDLLAGGPRDRPERQQTLRAAIGWSYSLLSADEQQIFARLSVFPAGFALEPAEEVAGADLETLGSLVEKSLVRVRDEPTTRFSMLETIRAYARERLESDAEPDEAMGNLARYYAGLLERLGNPVSPHLDLIEEEHPNILAAFEWALEREPELAVRIAAVVWRFWRIRSYYEEGLRWLRAAAYTNAGPRQARATLLAQAGMMALNIHDLAAAEVVLDEALELARDPTDSSLVATCLATLAAVVVQGGDEARGAALLEEGLSVVRAGGADLESQRMVVGNSANLALIRRDYERAAELFGETIALAHAIGSPVGLGWDLMNLGEAHAKIGDVEAAAGALAESLDLLERLGDRHGAFYALEAAATVAILAGEHERGARWLGAADAHARERGFVQEPFEAQTRVENLERLQAELGSESLEIALAEGARSSIFEAAAEARPWLAGIAARRD